MCVMYEYNVQSDSTRPAHYAGTLERPVALAQLITNDPASANFGLKLFRGVNGIATGTRGLGTRGLGTRGRHTRPRHT
jgi:hypothetical protein